MLSSFITNSIKIITISYYYHLILFAVQSVENQNNRINKENSLNTVYSIDYLKCIYSYGTTSKLRNVLSATEFQEYFIQENESQTLVYLTPLKIFYFPTSSIDVYTATFNPVIGTRTSNTLRAQHSCRT